ncbi:putative glycolipid-binding domain-containing protein [Patulibacter defluvii]|uniref:putative glycolipid-binding domain-containing protein n=1 Tax=Patulibacter defluvii TaxID=3095358 RepID=UPI002A750F01|nr:putative glycolipid-binding domain-containing protein [Patulibacter sp. DM4]
MPIAVAWRGLEEQRDGWRAEHALVDLDRDGLRASGVQLGVAPLPYRADYALEAGDRFATARLTVRVAGAGWSRSLDLRRADGRWTIDARAEGVVALPAPGGDTATLADAADCDLAWSPLTNLMPVRRHDLDRGPGQVELTVAWVALPALTVERSRQRYEHVDDGVVRFVALDDDADGFTADLTLDRDGLVVEYPALARRVAVPTPIPNEETR